MGPSSDLHLGQTRQVGQGLDEAGRPSASFWVFTQAAGGGGWPQSRPRFKAGLLAPWPLKSLLCLTASGPHLWPLLRSRWCRPHQLALQRMDESRPIQDTWMKIWHFFHSSFVETMKGRETCEMLFLTLADLWFCSFDCGAPAKCTHLKIHHMSSHSFLVVHSASGEVINWIYVGFEKRSIQWRKTMKVTQVQRWTKVQANTSKYTQIADKHQQDCHKSSVEYLLQMQCMMRVQLSHRLIVITVVQSTI